MLYVISIGAANFGIPGMLGKFKSVRISTMVTKIKTTIVPSHPIFLPCQRKIANIVTSSPNAMVQKSQATVAFMNESSQVKSKNPNKICIMPIKSWVPVKIIMPKLRPLQVIGSRLISMLLNANLIMATQPVISALLGLVVICHIQVV